MLFLAGAELCPYLFSSTLYVVVTIPELTHPRDAQRGPSRNRVATEHLSQESRRPAQGDRERAGAGEEPASGEALALWQDGRTGRRLRLVGTAEHCLGHWWGPWASRGLGPRLPAAVRAGLSQGSVPGWSVAIRVHATFSRVSTSVCPLCMTVTPGSDPPQRPRLNGTRLRQPRSKRGPFLRCEGQDSRV